MKKSKLRSEQDTDQNPKPHKKLNMSICEEREDDRSYRNRKRKISEDCLSSTSHCEATSTMGTSSKEHIFRQSLPILKEAKAPEYYQKPKMLPNRIQSTAISNQESTTKPGYVKPTGLSLIRSF